MHRRSMLWGLIGSLACAIAAPACGQEAAEARGGPTGNVTIFTDGLASPNGRISRVLREMAIAVDESKTSRAMLVMGYGGVGNVRDLLQSKGVDLAILNSDIFAYLDIAKAHPEARKKLRLVTPLFQQRVFLAARDGVASIDQLKGKRVAVLGAESSTGVTARTIFGLARVPVTFTRVDDQAPIDAEAALLLEDDGPRFLPRLSASGRFRLIPLIPAGALASAYRPAAYSAAEAPGLIEWSDVATVKVDTVLAVFDWTAGQPRYIDVTRFIDGLFGALPRLKRRFPGSVWDTIDLQANVPGWRRHAYAETAAAKALAAAPPPPVQPSAPEQLAAPVPPAQVQTAAPEQSAAQEKTAPGQTVAAAQPATLPPPAATDEALHLALTETPPLTEERLPQGGVIAELAMASLQDAFSGSGRAVHPSWGRDRQGMVAAVFEAKAAQFAAPWETPVCSGEGTGANSALLCDRALLSDPLFQLLYVLFVRPDSQFDLSTAEKATGGVLCTPADHDMPELSKPQRQWIAAKTLTVTRSATIIDCLGMMERKEADALLVNEIEGRFTLARLGLTGTVRMAETPVATRGVHIAMAKDEPGAEAMMAELNAAIARLRQSGRYEEIVTRHLVELQAEARQAN